MGKADEPEALLLLLVLACYLNRLFKQAFRHLEAEKGRYCGA